jgi:glycine/D-amino acid oxidase-like deaminating enzyme
MPVEVVPRAEQRREIASGLYHGGVLFHAHGGVHPALLHTGLLDAARRAGAIVAPFTPVSAVRPEAGGFSLTHGRGVLKARDVLACTNGYTVAGLPRLARRLVAMPSYMIATERLGQNRVRALIPNGRMIVETRQTHLYYRPSPDGERIILGGRAALHDIPLDVAARRLKHYLREVLPEIGDVGLSHAWTGRVCMTRSDMPFIGRLDGIWHAVGCNGSGVALMPYLGRKLALKVLGDPAGSTAYDGIEADPVPFHRGRAWFLPAMTAWWRFQDRRAGRTPPP